MIDVLIEIFIICVCTSFAISSLVGLILLYATRNVIKQMVVPLTVAYNAMNNTLKHQSDNEDERKVADKETLGEFRMLNRSLEDVTSQYREIQRNIPTLSESFDDAMRPIMERTGMAIVKRIEQKTDERAALLRKDILDLKSEMQKLNDKKSV